MVENIRTGRFDFRLELFRTYMNGAKLRFCDAGQSSILETFVCESNEEFGIVFLSLLVPTQSQGVLGKSYPPPAYSDLSLVRFFLR